MNEVKKKQVAQAFSRAAVTYQNSSVLQDEVGRRLLGHYELIRFAPQVVLDIGSGAGRTSEKLAANFPAAKVYHLDLSLTMLQNASPGIGQGICADMDYLPFADNSVDGIFANLSLHWSADFGKCLRELHRVLKVDGLLLFSLPGPDTLRELRHSWAGIDDFQHTNSFWDIHDVGDALMASQFADPVLTAERITLTYRTVNKIIQDLRETGTHTVLGRRAEGLTGKAKFQQLCANYELLRQDGRLPLTYEIVYAHAWKPAIQRAPKHPEIHEFHIPVEHILGRTKPGR